MPRSTPARRTAADLRSFLSLVSLAAFAATVAACGGSSPKKIVDGGQAGADGAAGGDAAPDATGGAGGADAATSDAPADVPTSDAPADVPTDTAPAVDAAPTADATDAAPAADGATDTVTTGDATDGGVADGDAGDGPAGDGATACDGEATCVAVAGSLSGLLWQLPCTGAVSGAVCATNASVTQTATLAGAAGTTYDVTLHFRGVVEQKTYAGGCAPAGGLWLAGGADDGDGYNVYRLTISSPPQTYFLNAGASNISHVFTVDDQQTVRIDAGATVTLFADPKDGQEILNVGADGTTPVTIAGTSVTQPYNGQFIEMDVVSLQADPVSSSVAVGGGSGGAALSFDGSQGQRVAIADATSLEPASLTLESWFTLSTPAGGYAVLAGKAYGGGSQDSWGVWYESGALHAGANLDSTSGSASVAWTPAAGQWHHAAEVFDAAAMQNLLYVDGQLVACTPGTPPVAYDTHAMLLGADYDGGGLAGFWSGALDEVRVFSTVRTPAQIWADMHTHALGPTTGLVGEWTFDEGSGQTAADHSGAGNVATLGATSAAEAADPSWITTGAPY